MQTMLALADAHIVKQKALLEMPSIGLPGGGDVLGGEAADICAAESRRPPNLCRIVDSSS